MFQLLILIITGLCGYFMPQIVFETDWSTLIAVIQNKNQDLVAGFLKKYNLINQTPKDAAIEKIIIVVAITLAIFIALQIIFKIIKKILKK